MALNPLTKGWKYCNILSMKKSWFVNCCCFVLLLFSGVFFVSCKDNSKPQNQVSDITIESKFFSTKIYQNTQIDLSDFNVYVTNTIDEDESFTLSQLYNKTLDTSNVGTHSFLLSYHNFTKAFDYQVLPTTMIDARFNGSPIEYFLHEGADIENSTFLALYSDGNEEKIPLSEASFSFTNLEVSDEIKTTTATYNGFEFEIEYVVKTRKIQANTTYDFIDKAKYFNNDKQLYSILSDTQIKIFTVKDGVPKDTIPLPISQSNIPNEFIVNQFNNGKFETFKIYLTKSGIVMEKIETSGKN